MHFAELPIADALGRIAAHTLRLDAVTIKKGTVLIDQDLDALRSAGITTIHVATAEPGELSEDDAVRLIAASIAGCGIQAALAAQGRSNLFATCDGVLRYDAERLDDINLNAPELNVLALRPEEIVRARQLIGQVKAIPYLVAGGTVHRACEAGARPEPLFRIDPFRSTRIGLLQTMLPGTRDSVLDKTHAVLGGKLQLWSASVVLERRCRHRTDEIAGALTSLSRSGCDLVLIVGASSTTDPRDVVPSALHQIGGRLVQLGVPLEPGTLLGFGYTDGDVPILILPGSLRAPVASSLDVIVPALLTGWRPNSAGLRRLGAGGLLKAVPEEHSDRKRHQPGTGARIGAVVLAAGSSRRMGPTNKLLLPVAGQPMLCRALRPLLELKLDPIIVVAGHDASQIRDALSDAAVTIIECPDYVEGMSTTLRTGIDALNHKVDAALVCLGDMPYLTAADLARIIEAFGDGAVPRICVPMHEGKQGNPVLWSRDYFGAMRLLRGDHGAKRLLAAYAEAIVPVTMASAAVLRDIDTPEDLPPA
ncbi:MAG: NTP transferase domain-containing protein [Gammaproteobacteria bacterium]|nr:NTP transferase domain-containing protein [Gammaproteobacteria bacterium]